MKLRMAFYLVGPWRSTTREIELPMECALESYGCYSVREPLESPKFEPAGEGIQALLVVGERDVDTAGMEQVDDIFWEELPDGERRLAKAVTCPEVYEMTEGARFIAGAISFGTRVSLELSPLSDFRMPNLFTAENEEDEGLLKLLGDRVRLPVSGPFTTDVIRGVRVDSEFVQDLAGRGTVGLYSEVLSATSPSDRYRALWRTLELAFQAQGKDLTRLVVAFSPANRLGFDSTELEALLTLRGKLGHAASRRGAHDVARADREAIESLGRLWSLVDWVMATKKAASRSLAFDEIQPLAAFITREGHEQVEQPVGLSLGGVDPASR